MILFEAAGLSCIQDLGRYGLQQQGIGVSGAMDIFAARVANTLLGNDDNAAVLELTLCGARLRICETQWFALTGADLDADIAGEPMPLCTPVVIEAGSVIRFKQAKRGCRAYLAVQHGFSAESVLGSVATDARSGLGGHHRRWMHSGDTLAYRSQMSHQARAMHWHTSWANPAFTEDDPLPFIPGESWPLLDHDCQNAWLQNGWTVSKDSDRMGLRLGEALPLTETPASVLSSAVAFGSIQLPSDGHPIILAADRQTTGGYPLIGTLAGLARSRLAQAKPGDTLRFIDIDVQDAQRRCRSHEFKFREWQDHMRQYWQHP